MVTRFRRWLAGTRGAARPGVLVSGGVAASAVLVAVALSTGGGGGGVNTANLWVDGDGGSCTRQSTAGTYSDAAACSTTAAAAACQPDDTIRIKDKGSSYGTWTLSGTHGTAGHPCTIKQAAGEDPQLGETQFNSSNWSVIGTSATPFRMGLYVCKAATGCTASPSSLSNIVVDYVDQAGSYWIRGGTNISVTNSTLHDWTDFTSQITDATNVLFANDIIRDAHLVTAGSHTDCMGVFGGTTNVTVRSTKFYNCEHADILVDNSVSGAFNTGMVVENNYFDVALTPGVSLGLTKCTSCLVRNNSFRGSGMSQVDNSTGSLIYSNIFEGTVNDTSICANATWTYNQWTGATGCSGTGNVTSTATGWVNASGTQGASDLHFSSCAAAGVNTAHPTLFPGTDYDGATRPVGAGADRGAFEKAGC